MRKLFWTLALLVLPVVALANDEREVLLTSDGTLYIAQALSSVGSSEVDSSVMQYIELTVRRGTENHRFVVPGTLEAGLHKNPALAFDDKSQTLFVFWQRSSSLLHSELLFQSMASDFTFGPAAAFGNGRNMRENLRIAVTRKADALNEDGQATSTVQQINVHAVWWETDTYDGQESAQYAMLAIEDGAVIEDETSIHMLYEFVDAENAADRFVPNAAVNDIFKHPSLVASPQQDSVLVLFGEVRDDSFNRVRIRPSKAVGQARVHIPVGRKEGPSTHAPRFLDAAANGRVSTIVGGGDRVAIYTTEGKQLNYMLFSAGKWSERRVLQLDENLTRDVAINAVRRLIEHE